MVQPIEIRPATSSELDLILAWAEEEGWNPGTADAAPFLAADAEGFLVARLAGEPIASISVVRYGDAFAFLGFYICRPEFRGRGHGLAIWNAGIDHAGGRAIGLDGVVSQQANYAKSGFVLAHRNIRYGGIARESAPADRHIVGLSGDTLHAALLAYDRDFFPASREAFLREWLKPPRQTLVYLRDGAILGYATLRACGSGYKIGPLFADDESIAIALFAALASRVPDEPIFLDVPEVNPHARRLAEAAALEPVFETARMYRGPAPELPLARIFGITTFELG